MPDELRLLISSSGFPTHQRPANCPFIGYRLSVLREKISDVAIVEEVEIKNPGLSGIRLFIWKIYIILKLLYQGSVLTTEKIGWHKVDVLSIRNGDFFFFRNIGYRWPFLRGRIKTFHALHTHFLWQLEYSQTIVDNLKLPHFITAHGSDVHRTMQNDEQKRIFFLDSMERAAGVFFTSRFIENLARDSGFQGNHTMICFNGIDTDVFHYSPEKESKNFVIGYLGHLYEVKGAHFLPAILNKVLTDHQEVVARIIGDGDYRYTLRKQLESELGDWIKKKRVHFAGEIHPEQVPEELKNFDVLIFPSLNEGFPTAVIEAQASGVPVIGSDAGGNPEAIDAEAGMCIPPGPGFEDSMAEAIRERIGKNNRDPHLAARMNSFSWENIVQSEVDFIKKAMENKNAG